VIRNSRQAAVARRRHKELMQAAQAAEPGQRSSFIALADDLVEELREYEAIRTGHITVFEVKEVDDLGDSLVKARLAKGWTQRHLADGLGVSEQMVQKDEARSYEHAGLARLAEVADVLGYELTGSFHPTVALGTPLMFVAVPSSIATVAVPMPFGAATVAASTGTAAAASLNLYKGFSPSTGAWETPMPIYTPFSGTWPGGYSNSVPPLQANIVRLHVGYSDASAVVPLQEVGAGS
jgi:ribosome-binding protein aMBF1 (putative translation factor)